MDEKLASLRTWLGGRPAGGRLGEGDLERLLAWAVTLTGAGYGYLEAGDVQHHIPKPAHVTVPEEPWSGVKVSLKACLGFAAQTARRPLVFDRFPPPIGDGKGGRIPLGGSFLRVGGRLTAELASPAGFLVAPLPGYGRHACLLLDGQGARYGQEACDLLTDLIGLATTHGGPWPRPEELLEPRKGGGGEVPVLELASRRFPITTPLTVGQDERSEVVIQDELTSRRHCIVVPLVDRSVMVIDLRSSNGTFVNGNAIDTHVLTPGDVIHTKQRKWALVYRMVEPVPEPSALPAGVNRLGYDLTRDRGEGLRAMVESWAPTPGGGSLAEFCELTACQLGLTGLVVLWRRDGKLCYCGATLSPGPARLEEIPPVVARLLRTLEAGAGRALAEGSAGIAPLARQGLGEWAGVAWTLRDGAPRPDPALLVATLETALGRGEAPPLAAPGEGELASFRERASHCSSGTQCAALVQEVYRAGFPSEAVEIGRSMATRFFDAEDVEAAIQAVAGLL